MRDVVQNPKLLEALPHCAGAGGEARDDLESMDVTEFVDTFGTVALQEYVEGCVHKIICDVVKGAVNAIVEMAHPPLASYPSMQHEELKSIAQMRRFNEEDYRRTTDACPVDMLRKLASFFIKEKDLSLQYAATLAMMFVDEMDLCTPESLHIPVNTRDVFVKQRPIQVGGGYKVKRCPENVFKIYVDANTPDDTPFPIDVQPAAIKTAPMDFGPRKNDCYFLAMVCAMGMARDWNDDVTTGEEVFSPTTYDASISDDHGHTQTRKRARTRETPRRADSVKRTKIEGWSMTKPSGMEFWKDGQDQHLRDVLRQQSMQQSVSEVPYHFNDIMRALMWQGIRCEDSTLLGNVGTKKVCHPERLRKYALETVVPWLKCLKSYYHDVSANLYHKSVCLTCGKLCNGICCGKLQKYWYQLYDDNANRRQGVHLLCKHHMKHCSLQNPCCGPPNYRLLHHGKELTRIKKHYIHMSMRCAELCSKILAIKPFTMSVGKLTAVKRKVRVVGTARTMEYRKRAQSLRAMAKHGDVLGAMAIQIEPESTLAMFRACLCVNKHHVHVFAEERVTCYCANTGKRLSTSNVDVVLKCIHPLRDAWWGQDEDGNIHYVKQRSVLKLENVTVTSIFGGNNDLAYVDSSNQIRYVHGRGVLYSPPCGTVVRALAVKSTKELAYATENVVYTVKKQKKGVVVSSAKFEGPVTALLYTGREQHTAIVVVVNQTTLYIHHVHTGHSVRVFPHDDCHADCIMCTTLSGRLASEFGNEARFKVVGKCLQARCVNRIRHYNMAGTDALCMDSDGVIRKRRKKSDMKVNAHMYANTHCSEDMFAVPSYRCCHNAAVLDDAHCVQIMRDGEPVTFINTTSVSRPCSQCGEESSSSSATCSWCQRHKNIDTFSVTSDIADIKTMAENELGKIMPRDLRTLPVLVIPEHMLPPQKFVSSPRRKVYNE